MSLWLLLRTHDRMTTSASLTKTREKWTIKICMCECVHVWY